MYVGVLALRALLSQGDCGRVTVRSQVAYPRQRATIVLAAQDFMMLAEALYWQNPVQYVARRFSHDTVLFCWS